MNPRTKINLLSGLFFKFLNFRKAGGFGVWVNHELGIRSKKRGFSFAEMVIVIAVTSIIFTITLGVFGNLNRIKALEKETVNTLSILAKARSLTLGSKNSNQYGVHFEPSLVTLFKGSSYSVSDPANIPTSLNSLVQISGISLTGGGSDLIFDRLTGKTSEDGTVTFSLVSSSTISRTITVYKSGLAE